MLHVTVGTDTYGRVKAVGGTPIVTQFEMLQFLPLFPLQSFYCSGPGTTTTSGIPLIASSRLVEVQGIPLARVDPVSVAMAYARGVFGGMTVIGFLAIFPVIMYFTGEHLDEFATIGMRGLVACFIVGIAGGLLTYAIPLTSQREFRIRSYCGELLGICADPARVSAHDSVALEEFAAHVASQERVDDARCETIRQLISFRAKIAQGIDPSAMERQTDEVLDRLAAR